MRVWTCGWCEWQFKARETGREHWQMHRFCCSPCRRNYHRWLAENQHGYDFERLWLRNGHHRCFECGYPLENLDTLLEHQQELCRVYVGRAVDA